MTDHEERQETADTMKFAFFDIVMMALLCGMAPLIHAAETSPDFESEIVPLLLKRCVECHQPPHPSGSLLLTTGEGLQAGGDSGPVIDAAVPHASLILERVESGEMPPEQQGRSQKLPAAEIDLLRRWIAAGATWPGERRLDWFERTNDRRAGRDWWALQPVRRPPVPSLRFAVQPDNPIDAFVLARLEEHRMQPAPAADRPTLLRRVYFDMIGLPPTREQIESFTNDTSADAWSKVIDRLLNSPHYGERWARYWLDLVRYADTSGYERDQEKPFAWKYRDWVVDAFNNDMPYDRFVVEQLAGDEIAERDERSVIATGFLRLGTWNDEPNDPLDYRYERLEDLVHVTSSAFLGLTVKCARCHSHKFDPITQEDYYRMGSAFWAGPITARERALLGGPSAAELGVPDVLGWTDVGRRPPPLHILKNGEREHPLHEVAPASLSFVPKLERAFDPPEADSATSERRLQLARWITDPEHPLPARVLVNRLWQHHFGQGIVRSPNNFGFLADPPTHPELLDWLAAEFVENGWSIKHIHRLILTSRTWRQSSLHPLSEEYRQHDAGNRLLWHAERRRQDAEALRDSMLTVTGELDRRLGGPGFRPTIAAEALEGLSQKSAAWTASTAEQQRRRSLYIFSKRGLLLPMMTSFDQCDTTQPCGRRDVTILPTQALTLLNNEFVHQRAASLGQAIDDNSDDLEERIRQLWRLVYGRPPAPEEVQQAQRYVLRQTTTFQQQQKERIASESDRNRRHIDRLGDSRVLQLRADTGITLDSSGGVLAWHDQSPGGHHARQSQADFRPRLEPRGFGGQPTIQFNGRGQFLNLDGALLDRQHCTVIVVADDHGPGGHRELLSNWNGSQGNAGTSMFLGLTSEKTVRFSDAMPDGGRIEQPQKPFILSAINGEQRAAVFCNGQTLVDRAGRLPDRNLSTDWVIGTQGNIGGEFWTGNIAEVHVYDRALSDDERQLIEQRLAERYAIPLHLSEVARRISPQVRALSSLALVLLNSNEFLFVD